MGPIDLRALQATVDEFRLSATYAMHMPDVRSRPKRSRVRIPAGPLPGNSLRQVAHTHVSLSPSTIIWYRPVGGDAV